MGREPRPVASGEKRRVLPLQAADQASPRSTRSGTHCLGRGGPGLRLTVCTPAGPSWPLAGGRPAACPPASSFDPILFSRGLSLGSGHLRAEQHRSPTPAHRRLHQLSPCSQSAGVPNAPGPLLRSAGSCDAPPAPASSQPDLSAGRRGPRFCSSPTSPLPHLESQCPRCHPLCQPRTEHLQDLLLIFNETVPQSFPLRNLSTLPQGPRTWACPQTPHSPDRVRLSDSLRTGVI